MKNVNSILFTLFAGITGSALVLNGMQAKAGAIDEIVDNVVVSVVESLTKDLSGHTQDEKEQKVKMEGFTSEPRVADDRKARDQQSTKCSGRNC